MRPDTATVRRLEITFPSGNGECSAWLYVPSASAPLPCIVLGNTMGATKADRLGAYAERFAEAGFVALAFDYRNFGDSSGRTRQVCDIPGQIADFNAALEFVKTRAEVDVRRLGLWGGSLGGGHVVVVGASRDDIGAIVSFAPAADCTHIALHIPRLLLMRLVWACTIDIFKLVLMLRPHTVPLVAQPGQLGVMTTAGTQADYQRMVEPGSLWRNEVAARLFLRLPLYRPIRKANRVTAPLLVGVCDQDDIAYPSRAAAMARLAPLGEAVHYPAGHLNGFTGSVFEKSVDDQVAFFRRHLRA